jgi:hypothetical protein
MCLHPILLEAGSQQQHVCLCVFAQALATYEMHSRRSVMASLTRGELSHMRGAS